MEREGADLDSFIKAALPLQKIRDADKGEKVGGSGHPANMHIWWGRTPIASTEMLLKAAVSESPSARPTVFDPFAGYGGIPLAAQKAGLPSVSSDLNPVAVILNKASTEIPMLFSDALPVNGSPKKLTYHRAEGLAEDVQYYGQWLLARAEERLKTLYPKADGKTVQAWLWTRTAKCPNPVCGCKIPLSASFLLDSRKGRETWAEPVFEKDVLRFRVRHGICPLGKETNKYPGQGARFRCLSCGEITSDSYIKEQGKARKLGNVLLAMLVEDGRNKYFVEVNAEQESASQLPAPDSVPEGEIFENAHWFSPPEFGFTNYGDLFTARQLTMLLCFSGLLKETQYKAASDALSAGMSPFGGHIRQNGNGALAYGEAVAVYLALLVDMLADHHSTVCSWNQASGGIRNTFRRQAIPMTWNYAEANPLSNISGNYRSLLSKLTEAIAELPCGANNAVTQGDAAEIRFPENVLICTEPPYYKSIGYSYLSDFFYIWLRLGIGKIYPDLFDAALTPKMELTTSSEYYGTSREEARNRYESQMASVCKKLFLSANEQYPTLLFFAYTSEDAAAINRDDSSNARPSPWEAMIANLLSAGFSISGTLPVSDKKALNASATRVLIVCKKTLQKKSSVTRRDFVTVLKKTLPKELDVLLSFAQDTEKSILAMGCGLSIYTSYASIMNASGSNMSVHDALQIIAQKTEEYFARESVTEDENLMAYKEEG